MTEENRKAFSSVLRTKPVLLDAKWLSWCHRPRLFWCSWEVQALGEEELFDQGDYLELRLPLTRGCDTEWLDAGCHWNRDKQSWLPTLTRPRKRARPPKDPTGLAAASESAKERWAKDRYRLPVCDYEQDAMVTTSEGSLRLPSPTEREMLMGFDRGYVTRAITPKLTDEERFDLVGSMLGGSLHVNVIAVLMHSLLVNYGIPESRDLRALVQGQGEASAGWLLYPRFVPRCLETKDTAELVLHFIRQAERGGTDIRLDVGVPFRMQAWPRSGLNSSLFHWSVIHGYPWKTCAHINVLELQAVTNAVKWRLRKLHSEPYRALHLIDSQVVCAIVAKGRTSSFRLRKGLSKLNCLLLASGLILIVGYVSTDSNPSDIPSRWAEQRLGQRKSSAGSSSGRARL